MNKEEKVKKAVALRYEAQKKKAPNIVAKGKGKLAEKIIEIAKQYNIHVHQDPDLTNILYKLELLEEIPPHLYSIIAEVFAFLYQLNRRSNLEERGS